MINYLILINVISFIIYGLDKYKAIKKKRRISEKTLLIISLMGGPIGSILGMYTFRHKTKKIKFKLLNPLILILWIIIYVKGLK